MLEHKSKLYIRDGEQKVVYDELKIDREDWCKAAQYAMDPTTKSKVFNHGAFYYILLDGEFNEVEGRIHDGAAASEFFHSTEAISFDEYQRVYHQRVYQVKFESNWQMSICSCPQFMGKLFCKHVLAIALLADANPALLGPKPKRGRKSHSKGALFKPNS